MKSVIIVVALCLAFALSQSIPASSNPAGASYFSSAVVGTLGLNQTISSSLYNTTGNTYQEFWKIWVPSYVGAVRYTVNNTGSDTNWVEVQINFISGHEDSTFGFPCEASSGSYGASCYDYDTSFEVYTGEYDYYEYSSYDYFQPGQWQFVTVNRYYSSSAWVNYTLRVEASFECPNNSYVSMGDASLGCVSNSAINNVTTNGATYSGSLATTSQLDVYRVSVPQNVSRVWAWVTSSIDDLEVYIDASQIASSIYYNYNYDDSGYTMTSGGYSYYVEYDLPEYNLPVFIAVQAYSTTGAYNISIHWSACGSTMSGYGEISNDYSTAVSTFPYVADCSDPISVNNFNPMTSLATLNFALPAYNDTSDYYYAGSYGFMYIPPGTVGSLNFTCNSTSDYVHLVVTANGPSDCEQGATWSISCNGPSSSSSEYLWILSEDLYPGGYWSIGVCSDDSVSSTTSLVSTGSVAAGASVSPSPGSDHGTGGGGSSSGSSTLIPALLFVVLAAMFAL